MKSSLHDLADRKAALVALAAAQREQVRLYYREALRPAKMVSQVGGFLKNPLVLLGLSAITYKLPWRKFVNAGRWIWKGVRLVRSCRSIV